MSEFALEAARSALLEAQRIQAQETAAVLALRDALQAARERGAELELALDRERTGRLQAEERVAELEYLIADHEFEAEEYDTLAGLRISVCPVCGGHDGHHTHGLNLPCPWGEAAANHRARQAHAALAEFDKAAEATDPYFGEVTP